MYKEVVLTFIDLFVVAFNILLLIRVVLSWISPGLSQGNFTQAIVALTDPVLAPVRKLLPSSQLMDLSPLVTFFLLQLLQGLAHSLIS